MHTRSIASMSRELLAIKLAASVKTLHKAYRRLNPLRVHGSPAQTLKNMEAMQNVPSAKTIGGAMGPATLPGNKFVRKLIAEGVPENLRGMDADDYGKAVEFANKNLAPRGRTSLQISTGGGGSRVFKRIAPSSIDAGASTASLPAAVKGLTGPGHKATNILTGLHEGHEAAAVKGVLNKKHPIVKMHSHLHPEVIMKEHNMLRNLSGEGADEARKVFQQLRGGEIGEGNVLNKLLTDAYGPRAAVQFGAEGSPRITKAMRKDMRRRLTEDTYNKALVEHIQSLY